jgi:prepilin-type processing-associated H-X9-DG protein
MLCPTRRRTRTGLSRVELSVVVVVCVLAAGVILPRVQAARADADRLKCADNLRALGAAFAEYEKAHGGFPPRRTGRDNGDPHGGWGTAVLPYLGEANLAKTYDLTRDYYDPANRAVVETAVKPFLCPASPADGRVVPIRAQASPKSATADKDTTFAVKAAACDYISSNGVLLPENGYGLNADLVEGMNSNHRQPLGDDAPMPLAKTTDGLSCTLLLVEQAGRPAHWQFGKKVAGEGQFGMTPNARGAWAGWGSVLFGAADADTGKAPGRGDGTDRCVNADNWNGVYSFHAGGANVLMCDGAVRFVTPKLDPLTFAYLTLRDDGHGIADADY